MKPLLEYGAKVKRMALLSAMSYTDPVPFIVPLLMAGVNVNTRDSRGHTPFMDAIGANLPDAVRILLDHGADIDAADDGGCTALHQWV